MAKKKTVRDKVRVEYLFIDGDEVERIVKNNLGGITFKAEVYHSRVVLTAWTGEDEKVNASQF